MIHNHTLATADYHHQRAARLLGSHIGCALRYHRLLLQLCIFVAALGGVGIDWLLGYGIKSAVPVLREERYAWAQEVSLRCLPRSKSEQVRVRMAHDGSFICVTYGGRAAPDGWQESLSHRLLRESSQLSLKELP